MSFSTCSCVLWQKEQRSGSSGVNRFTCYAPLWRTHLERDLGPIVERKLAAVPRFIVLTANYLERFYRCLVMISSTMP